MGHHSSRGSHIMGLRKGHGPVLVFTKRMFPQLKLVPTITLRFALQKEDNAEVLKI
uniref:Uncharacterized protein n=1 Tax=Rhizophora mucronata TaxID=61149 RepID=A0A2P2J455_RHIMU